jgi:hypothetical protein
MAGAGRKVFTAGDVLTASQVQDYLQDQAVMVFAGTAARSSAISSPSEGMVSVQTDLDDLTYYNGSAWTAGLSFGAWKTWAPTLSGGWANGNGTWTADYIQIGKTVHVRGKFVLGTTTTKGANLNITLPITASTNSIGTNSTTAGFAVCAGVNTALLWGYVTGSTTITLFAMDSAATYLRRSGIDASTPAVWATGDQFNFSVTYEAA